MVLHFRKVEAYAGDYEDLLNINDRVFSTHEDPG
jgi:hypothetical protein